MAQDEEAVMVPVETEVPIVTIEQVLNIVEELPPGGFCAWYLAVRLGFVRGGIIVMMSL